MDEVIQVAVGIATSLHSKQFRKNKINGISLPYITHPLEVMKRVWRWGAGSSHNMIASLLHDVFEDCFKGCEIRYSKQTLKQMFETELGYTNDIIDKLIDKSLNIVEELTFVGESCEKSNYMSSFYNKSIDSVIIKMSDRFCNCLDFYCGGDCDYAYKYYNKAQNLFDVFKTRKQEIIDAYGKNTFENIELCREELFN